MVNCLGLFTKPSKFIPVLLKNFSGEGFCGPWEGTKYIHENEAVFVKKTALYYERRCYKARSQ